MRDTALEVATASLNAALYAALGALWTLFPVTLFGVRFWPQVFAPGAFAVLFGPWVGGIGAGVGIFIADVVYGHHDALLSLLVGVPSNFVGFGLIGYLSRRPMKGSLRLSTIAAGLAIPVVIVAYAVYAFSGSVAMYVVMLGAVVTALLAVPYLARSRWAEVQAASSIGLGVGSLIIGLGIVAYSSFFVMPEVLGLGSGPLPVVFAVGATLWTYMSEIPFLLAFTPPSQGSSSRVSGSKDFTNRYEQEDQCVKQGHSHRPGLPASSRSGTDIPTVDLSKILQGRAQEEAAS